MKAAPKTDSDPTPRLRLYLDDAAAVDDLFRQSVRARGTPALPEFLNFLARFQRHSLFNPMLIRVQRPGAMAVAARRRWLEYGRVVSPDAVPIILLQPFGPVQFVYDVGDTQGPPPPNGGEWGPFAAAGKIPIHAWDKAVDGAGKCGVTIELIDNYGSGLAGTAAPLGRNPILHQTDGSFLTKDPDAPRFE